MGEGDIDLETAYQTLSKARPNIGGPQTEGFGSALDKLLKFASIQKGKPGPDAQPLAEVIDRLNRIILHPISTIGQNVDICFAPAMKKRVDLLSSHIVDALDGGQVIGFKKRVNPKLAVQQLSEALDEFGDTEFMSAHAMSRGGRKKVLIRDNGMTPRSADVPSLRSQHNRSNSFNYPRLRILVLGKSGMGKSSLINKTFNVEAVEVSHFTTGRSNIHQEIKTIGPNKLEFVLHDSQGFEPGESYNLDIVKDFIRKRNMMPSQRDKIHAVWFCLQIPYAQGRVIDAVDEELLKVDFYGLPVIVVFTKFDLVTSSKEKEVCGHPSFTKWSDEEIEAKVDRAVKEEFEHACMVPLGRVLKGRSLPHITVSVCDPSTLSALIALTCDQARQWIADVEAGL